MLVVMNSRATAEQITAVCDKVRQLGFGAHPVAGQHHTTILVTGNGRLLDPCAVEHLPGVADVVRVSRPYKLAGREAHPEATVIQFPSGGPFPAPLHLGGDEVVIVAGPCAIESREQAFAVAERVARAGAHFFRGGAYKPRTSPYSFQGLGLEGLRILAEIRERYGMRIVTEAVDHESLDLVEKHADMIQIGARNMQNFSLLRQAGRAGKPILLKRGMAATLDELLMAAEYLMSEGNSEVVLCERGVRTFSDHSRNTLDLSVIPALRRLSHLPVMVDPSHGTGRRSAVPAMARASVAAGADAVMIEVHHQPECALSDGSQCIIPEEFERLQEELRQIAAVLRRPIAPSPHPSRRTAGAAANSDTHTATTR